MACCNKKTKYSLNQLTEVIEIYKGTVYNNENGDYTTEKTIKGTFYAKIETKNIDIETFDGMIRESATTHRIIIRWNANLFGNIQNTNRINTGDKLIIKKSGEVLNIISIVNENSNNLFAILGCSNKGDANNIQNF